MATLPPGINQGQDPGHGTSVGQVVAVRGTVLDIRFPTTVPPLGSAIHCRWEGHRTITAVADAHLAHEVVRGIALHATRGLCRATRVEYEGRPLTIPVGRELLGRVIDLHGKVLDGGPPLGDTRWAPISRQPPGSALRLPTSAIYPTGIKVIDLFCPFTHGGRAAVFGGAGVGKTIVLMEFIHNAVEHLQGVTAFARYIGRQRLLEVILRELLYIELYQMWLESLTAEHGVRLVAAGPAADWLEDRLAETRAIWPRFGREAATQELLDIVSGTRRQLSPHAEQF